MHSLQIKDNEIILSEQIPQRLRLLLVVVGLLPILLVPYKLFVRHSWSLPGLILPVLMTIGAVLGGGLFLAAGLLGLEQSLVVSKSGRTIRHTRRSAVFPLRTTSYGFEQLSRLSVVTHDWTDGPSTHGLQFVFNQEKTIELGSFQRKQEAEQALYQIQALLHE